LDAYSRLFERFGREPWAALIKPSVSALHRASKDGEHLAIVQAGDYVYDLRQPRRTGMDDVLVFVLRPVEGTLKIVGHWADY
jgi:hypothetical protein